MLTHLRIQWHLAFWLAALLVGFHFFIRVFPGIGQPWRNFEPQRALPYVAVVLSICLLALLRKNRIESYKEFLENSPGIPVNAAAIRYGVGHPTDPEAPKPSPAVPSSQSSAAPPKK
jgi:hypothetical protein